MECNSLPLNFMITGFKTLKFGEYRQRGDQIRQLWNHNSAYGSQVSTVPPNPTDWHEISFATIGWKILPGDLFNAEFRRPLI